MPPSMEDSAGSSPQSCSPSLEFQFRTQVNVVDLWYSSEVITWNGTHALTDELVLTTEGLERSKNHTHEVSIEDLRSSNDRKSCSEILPGISIYRLPFIPQHPIFIPFSQYLILHCARILMHELRRQWLVGKGTDFPMPLGKVAKL